MLYYIRKYPISLLIIVAVIYLSFFKPPSSNLAKIPHLDKIVHFCMYAGLSGVLWLEFLWTHRIHKAPMWHAWVGALILPILFRGCIEILQEYGTDYRGGDWLDFAAISFGAIVAR